MPGNSCNDTGAGFAHTEYLDPLGVPVGTQKRPE